MIAKTSSQQAAQRAPELPALPHVYVRLEAVVLCPQPVPARGTKAAGAQRLDVVDLPTRASA